MDVYIIYKHDGYPVDKDSARIIGIFEKEEDALKAVRYHYGVTEPDIEWDGFLLFKIGYEPITIEPYPFNKFMP